MRRRRGGGSRGVGGGMCECNRKIGRWRRREEEKDGRRRERK